MQLLTSPPNILHANPLADKYHAHVVPWHWPLTRVPFVKPLRIMTDGSRVYRHSQHQVMPNEKPR